MRPRLYLRGFFLFLTTFIAAAQEPAVVSNNGQPMHIAYACAEDDLNAAGMACTPDQPCAIYLELSMVAANGAKLLASGDLHSSSATLASILLLSEDSGA